MGIMLGENIINDQLFRKKIKEIAKDIDDDGNYICYKAIIFPRFLYSRKLRQKRQSIDGFSEKR